jgi:hypothetical protein
MLSAIALVLLAGALPASSAFAQDIQDEVRPRGGVTTRFYPHVGIQLMRTFYFRFLNSDHHISIMEVSTDTPSLNEATINFQDDEVNDPYTFRIQHQDVTNVSGIFTGNFGPEVCKGSCTLPIARPVGDFVFVLRGFYVQYIGPDHHIQRFGIFEDGNGNITAALRDNDLGKHAGACTPRGDLHPAHMPTQHCAHASSFEVFVTARRPALLANKLLLAWTVYWSRTSSEPSRRARQATARWTAS